MIQEVGTERVAKVKCTAEQGGHSRTMSYRSMMNVIFFLKPAFVNWKPDLIFFKGHCVSELLLLWLLYLKKYGYKRNMLQFAKFSHGRKILWNYGTKMEAAHPPGGSIASLYAGYLQRKSCSEDANKTC